MSRRRRRRSIGSLILGFIELILAIVIFVLIAIGAAYFLCPLKTVEVEGTDLYTDEEIINYIIDDNYSHNTVYAFIKNKVFPKGDAEFIDSFDVSIKGPHSLLITCNEKPILGYILTEEGQYIYFDYDGDITEISETFVDRGYMQVDGVNLDEPKIGKKLPIGDDEMGYLTSLIKILQKNSLMPKAVTYDEKNHITIKYETYSISLGNSYLLEEKIDRMLRILPQIEGLYGTLHLENYSSQNTDIVFEKDTAQEQ